MALTKAEMSEYLFDKLGLSKRDAKELVELFFEEIRRALENGEQVKLSGFGNFDLRDKNQRPGRNPKTGEDIPITARRVVTFRPGQKLKSRVENASPKDEQSYLTKKAALRPFFFSLSKSHRKINAMTLQQNGYHADTCPPTTATKYSLVIMPVSFDAAGASLKPLRR